MIMALAIALRTLPSSTNNRSCVYVCESNAQVPLDSNAKWKELFCVLLFLQNHKRKKIIRTDKNVLRQFFAMRRNDEIHSKLNQISRRRNENGRSYLCGCIVVRIRRKFFLVSELICTISTDSIARVCLVVVLCIFCWLEIRVSVVDANQRMK